MVRTTTKNVSGGGAKVIESEGGGGEESDSDIEKREIEGSSDSEGTK